MTTKKTRESRIVSDKTPRDGSRMLLTELIRDPQFAVVPTSEKAVSDRLGLPLTGVREAIIGFVSNDWLERGHRGVCRPPLNSWGLVQLFGTRLNYERSSLRKAVRNDDETRLRVDGMLSPIISRQEEIATSADEDEQIEWFCCSVNFHVALVRSAGFGHNARHLERILWQIRFGARYAIESEKTRVAATEEHREIVEGIKGAREFNEDEYIQKHIREPFERAVHQLKGPTDSSSLDRYWSVVQSQSRGE